MRRPDDGAAPIDNNQVEIQIRPWVPWALGLVVCRIATQRKTGGGDHELDPAAGMHRHDPYAYLKDALTLQTQRGE